MIFGLLVPLGLLALLTIPVLILIYIIRPNYQVKHLSSTYVWQLSLKYKKRRIPINKLRNLLIFLCQLLILTAISLIIARPALVYDKNVERSDVIAIIDSSASMYTKTEGETRFHRAVGYVEDLAEDTLQNGGAVSVILADDDPKYLASRLDATNRTMLMETLAALEEETACSYGKADIEAALRLSETILAENPTAKVYIYTDTSYERILDDNVYINRLSNSDEDGTAAVVDREEWNAAVLNAEAAFIDGSYQVTVEVACYGSGSIAHTVPVVMQVSGPNGNLTAAPDDDFKVEKSVDCFDGETKTVIFCNGGGIDTENVIYFDLELADHAFTSYESIIVSIDEPDSFDQDNSYQIYGGRKERINILYSSNLPTVFFSSALDVLRNYFMKSWDIRVTEVRHDDGSTPIETTGYDLYIYEGRMPDVLPADGIVFLIDPDKCPSGAGFTKLGMKTYTELMELSPEEDHPLMRSVIASNIHVTRFQMITTSIEYKVLMSCESNPLLLVRDEGNSKIVLMPFSLHYSDLPILTEWYTLINNIMTFFLPQTLSANSFEVGEQLQVNPRGPTLHVFDGAYKDLGTYEREENTLVFTVPLTFDVPGMYVLEQSSYFDENYSQWLQIFVKIPVYESNIWAKEAMLPELLVDEETSNTVEELLVWFAAALVALLFAEWFLHSRENK